MAINSLQTDLVNPKMYGLCPSMGYRRIGGMGYWRFDCIHSVQSGIHISTGLLKSFASHVTSFVAIKVQHLLFSIFCPFCLDLWQHSWIYIILSSWFIMGASDEIMDTTKCLCTVPSPAMCSHRQSSWVDGHVACMWQTVMVTGHHPCRVIVTQTSPVIVAAPMTHLSLPHCPETFMIVTPLRITGQPIRSLVCLCLSQWEGQNDYQ